MIRKGSCLYLLLAIDLLNGALPSERGILDGDRKPPLQVTYSDEIKKSANKIKHVIVIMQENWSFDSLYGKFPGVNGLENAKAESFQQVNLMGQTYPFLPPSINTRTSKPYAQIPKDIPNRPFDLEPFISLEKKTGDVVHDFYLEQYQINGGLMNEFVTYSDSGGFVMSYYDIQSHAIGRLAKEYVLCDNWFHSCYGGSMCAALWLFSAQMPVWTDPPKDAVAELLPSGALLKNGWVSPDGYAINDADPYYAPHPKVSVSPWPLPPQTTKTIGDLLTSKNISWKWYAEGWDNVTIGDPDPSFAYHHQAPLFFKQYAPNTPEREKYVADLNLFYLDLKTGQIPEVSFIRSLDKYSQHPGSGSLKDGLDWCAQLVNLIKASPIWENCVIIVTYDENGGRWDHVSPPVVDRFGPGTRVPTMIISPYAKKGFVDHTSYETVSILKFIEERWDLQPLSSRDAAANNILNAFDF